jgi:hypothetical protein
LLPSDCFIQFEQLGDAAAWLSGTATVTAKPANTSRANPEIARPMLLPPCIENLPPELL